MRGSLRKKNDGNKNNGAVLANKLKWKVIVSKFKSMFWGCGSLLSFVWCSHASNSGLSSNGNFNAAFYRLISSFSVVKLTVSVPDLNGLKTTYRKRILSIGHFAQWFSMNNLLEIFRYIINEISTNNFNCEEIPHNLTLWATTTEGLGLITNGF